MSTKITDSRLDQAEKRFMSHDARMDRIETKLDRVLEVVNAMSLKVASLPTKEMLAGWSLAIILAVVGSMIGLLTMAQNGEIAMFQAGLGASQVKAITSAPAKP